MVKASDRTPRDAQRAAVYRAEDRIGWGRPLPKLTDVQKFIDHVLESANWAAPGVPRIIVARDGRGRRHACSQQSWFGGEVRLPKWARHELIVLHELAHTRVPSSEPAHGPGFVAEYLRLVRRHLASEIGEALERSLRGEGIELCPSVMLRSGPSGGSRRILRLVR